MRRRLALVSLLALATAEAASAQVQGSYPTEVDVSLHLPGAVPGGVTTIPSPGTMVAATPPPSTVITPDMLADRTLGTTVTDDGTAYRIDGGTLSGTNLFHSFQQFDLAAGDIAMWVHSQSDPTTITNVINRVTGGDPSDIFGTIDSTAIPNADFYFINPSGIVFGNGAQVNVPAAAFFSTASELRFASGPAFQVASPDGSTLSVAPPQAFGFIGNEGAILVDDVTTGLITGGNFLGLVASDVLIESSFISSPLMNLAAIGSSGGVFDFTDLRGGTLAGTVRIVDSRLEANDAALIFVSAGDVELVRADLDIAAGLGDGTSGLNVFATDDISLTDSMILAERSLAILESGDRIDIANSAIFADSFDTLSQFGGAVVILAPDITIRDNSFVTADNFADDPSFNGAGFVRVEASNSLLIDNSLVAADSFAGGPAGFVLLSAPDLQVTNSTVSSEAFADGDAGGITLDAGNLEIVSSTISSTAPVGSAGQINLFGNTVSLVDSSILNDVGDEGFSGGISIFATDAVSLTDSFLTSERGFIAILTDGLASVLRTSVSADNFDTGPAEFGGFVTIEGGQVEILGSSISAANFSDSPDSISSGFINIFGADYVLLSQSFVLTNSIFAGPAGSMLISGGDVLIDESSLGSEAQGEGDAGNINIDAANLLFVRATGISSTAPVGSAGQIVLTGNTIELSDMSVFNDVGDNGFSGGITLDAVDSIFVTNAFLTSERGFVSMTAGNLLALESTTIFADNFDSSTSGSGGGITLTAANIDLFDSFITADNFSSDPSFATTGFIDLFATESIRIEQSALTSRGFDAGPAGFISIVAPDVTLETAFIRSSALGAGDAGQIVVAGNDIAIANSVLDTDVGPEGIGGGIGIGANNSLSILLSNITSTRGFILLRSLGDLVVDSSNVTADTFDSASEAFGGFVQVEAADLFLTNSRVAAENRSTAPSPFSEGSVDVFASNSITMVNSTISAATFGGGEGGDVQVVTPDLFLDLSSIEASTIGTGTAGDVTVDAGQIVLTNGSSLESQTESPISGDAGFVNVFGDSLSLTGGSFISSSTFAPGSAGGVMVDVDEIEVRSNSSIASQSGAFQGFVATGDAGDVMIFAQNLLVDTGGFIDSSTFGSGQAGSVTIEATNTLTVGPNGSVTSVTSGTGDAGLVQIRAGTLRVDQGRISTATFFSNGGGEAGFVDVAAQTIELVNGGDITSSTFGDGNAGDILLLATDMRMDDGSTISSNAEPGSTGESGLIAVGLDTAPLSTLQILGGSQISTNSANPNPAGGVLVFADTLVVDGVGSQIASRNTSFEGGDAGGVFIFTRRGTISNGGSVNTDSESGAAGDILFSMPSDDGILVISGAGDSGVITTSSGTNSGGRIAFLSPLAIIANGSEIRALGDVANAFVTFDTPYLISSADRLNIIAVDGVVEFSGAIYDVSAGTVNPDLSVLDASGVLRGQCPAVRSTGQLSQLTLRPIGPYAPPQSVPAPTEDQPPGAPPIGGDCL